MSNWPRRGTKAHDALCDLDAAVEPLTEHHVWFLNRVRHRGNFFAALGHLVSKGYAAVDRTTSPQRYSITDAGREHLVSLEGDQDA